MFYGRLHSIKFVFLIAISVYSACTLNQSQNRLNPFTQSNFTSTIRNLQEQKQKKLQKQLLTSSITFSPIIFILISSSSLFHQHHHRNSFNRFFIISLLEPFEIFKRGNETKKKKQASTRLLFRKYLYNQNNLIFQFKVRILFVFFFFFVCCKSSSVCVTLNY